VSDDEPVFLIIPEPGTGARVEEPSVQQIAERAGKLAVELGKDFPPAAALAVLKISQKVMVTLIERYLDAASVAHVLEHAELVASAVSPTLHATEGDG
jgi:hypothetical protein